MDWKQTAAGWCQSRQLMWEIPLLTTLTRIYRNVFFDIANKTCTYDLLLQVQKKKKKKTTLNCFAKPEWKHVCPNALLWISHLSIITGRPPLIHPLVLLCSGLCALLCLRNKLKTLATTQSLLCMVVLFSCCFFVLFTVIVWDGEGIRQFKITPRWTTKEVRSF